MGRRPIRRKPPSSTEQLQAYRALTYSERKAVPRPPMLPLEEVVDWAPSCWSCQFRPIETRHRVRNVGARQTGFCSKVQAVVHVHQVCTNYVADSLPVHSARNQMRKGLCEECRFQVMQGAHAVCRLHVPLDDQGDACGQFEADPSSPLKHAKYLAKRKPRQKPIRPKPQNSYYRAQGRPIHVPRKWNQPANPIPGRS